MFGCCAIEGSLRIITRRCKRYLALRKLAGGCSIARMRVAQQLHAVIPVANCSLADGLRQPAICACYASGQQAQVAAQLLDAQGDTQGRRRRNAVQQDPLQDCLLRRWDADYCLYRLHSDRKENRRYIFLCKKMLHDRVRQRHFCSKV